MIAGQQFPVTARTGIPTLYLRTALGIEFDSSSLHSARPYSIEYRSSCLVAVSRDASERSI